MHKWLQTKTTMLSEDKVTEIFCTADDFRKFFDAMIEKCMIEPAGKRKYCRSSTMSRAQVTLITIRQCRYPNNGIIHPVFRNKKRRPTFGGQGENVIPRPKI